MRTKEHRLIAEYIADNYCTFDKKIYRKAFMLGALYPVTKRGIVTSPVDGCEKILTMLSEKGSEDTYSLRDFYLMGRVIYTISESLTEMRRAYYTQSAFDRMVYNHELGRILHDITQIRTTDCDRDAGEFSSCVMNFRMYVLKAPANAKNDCRLIIKMTSAAAMCFSQGGNAA